MRDTVNPAESALYTYDNLNRLSGVSAGVMDGHWNITSLQWNMSWTYDDFGNRLTQTGAAFNGHSAPPAMSLSFDQATNRIITAGYTYDLNGNVTAMPGMTGMTWDVYDRLTAAQRSGYVADTSTYDAFGRRIEKTSGGSTAAINFYGPAGELLAQYGTPSAGNLPQVTRVYFAGQQIGQYTDRLGSVRYSRAGSIYRHYYPYGEELANTNNDQYKYAQLFRDSSTGLDYALNRYYASSIGRFLSVDRGRHHLGSPQSWNGYSYVGNDPINFTDAGGRERICTGPPDDRTCFEDDEDDDWRPEDPFDTAYEPHDKAQLAQEAAQQRRDEAFARKWAALIDRAFGNANKALDKPNCKKLFGLAAGSLDPKALLQSLYTGTSGYGYVVVAPIAETIPNTVTSATTSTLWGAMGIGNGASQIVGTGVEITINDMAGSFVSGSSADQMVTLLHELGHAFNQIYNAGGSQIKDDGAGVPDRVKVSEGNSKLIRDNCL